jgi:NADH-quinone oxidoreductase subunit L
MENMKTLIWLIPLLPLMSFLIISVFIKLLPKKAVATLAVGSVALSALVTIIAGINFLSNRPAEGVIVSTLYTWMSAGSFTANISLILDPLSLVFCFVITFVGALIHLYSVEFMNEDEGFSRFFAYMNLFVSSMLILVLADNLLLLYLGWEGVGLCSYLLIGFWYKEPENGYAARKAFIITRIGDTAMILGLFLLFISFGTLDINHIMQQAETKWAVGSPLATISALLLLGGALGKSAQLPLQTWLPDAMAGPSPVSALIHAATMVTAGVYLITRTHVLFTLAPAVMAIVAIIGALTLLMAGFSALAQHDLKRVLAYSTISQIGYMFLAMGIGAWSAGIFHFMIHAFFKALLFLAGGAVIHLLHDEHDIFRMGGIRKKMPVVFLTFLIGAASLSALPLITAGFYSKDQILWFGWSSELSSPWLWIAGIAGAFLTSLYTFRLVFIVFFGEVKTEPSHEAGNLMKIPLVVLAILSIIGGFIELPHNMGPVHLFTNLFGGELPEVPVGKESSELLFQVISAIISLTGLYIAYLLFYKKVEIPAFSSQSRINRFFLHGWQFDRLYDILIVRPYVWLAKINKNDFIDVFYNSLSAGAARLNAVISRTQTGRLRWYVLFFTMGIVILLTIMITI